MSRLFRVGVGGLGIIAGIALAIGALQLSSADPTELMPKEPDPCQGRRDEECKGTINKLRSDFNERYTNWINEFLASGEDYRSLPRHRSTALAPQTVDNLESAVRNADAIVVGTVEQVTFEVVPPDDPLGFAFVQGNARVAIDDTSKGDASKEVTINQFGGPEPNSDWATGHLLYTEGAPVLVEGEKVLLFLERDELGWAVQAWTGTYQIDDEGKLEAVQGNPYETSVEAKSLTQFSADIEALVAANAAQ